MESNIDYIYKRHNILKLCDIGLVNITLLKNAYIVYADNYNTNLLRTFVKSTYTLTRPRYAFVIPKYRLHISIHALHFLVNYITIYGIRSIQSLN